MSGKVAKALQEIVQNVRKVDELVAEVASASREQTQGISQINTAVGQMDKVTQSNAANAEESAAAAEELNAQAEIMKGSVTELLRLVGGGGQIVETPPLKSAGAAPGKTSANLAGNGFRQSKSLVRPSHAPTESAAEDGEDLIQWDEARMATGVESIDEQHQELIGMINRLHRACRSGTAKSELRQMMVFLRRIRSDSLQARRRPDGTAPVPGQGRE